MSQKSNGTPHFDHFSAPSFDGPVKILDGGMGSLMEVLGYKPDAISWSSGANTAAPRIVEEAHKLFIDAGADIIITNTYQSNILRKIDDGQKENSENDTADGVKCALAAAKKSGRDVKVVGSIGPFATYLCDGSEYTGAYLNDPEFDHERIKTNYRVHLAALRKHGIKTVVFETIPTAIEGKYAREILEESGLSGWIGATCRDGSHLANGDLFVDFVKNVADSPNLTAIGINCTSPKFIKDLLTIGREHSQGKPFVVYPNSGEYYDKEQSAFYGCTSIDLILSQVKLWRDLGAVVIGGCCRVTPDDIKGIVEKLRE
ncbi:unnamed protein product [Bursaphelenchus xylophilus]|uniref:(pine wood nematode) hypothetical protein n=1 Tax=Bursaphelenchus xylophilus TaxID=6326 RepID=A0A811L1F8_BURXY|nr:unnamed protein product [Bursaphelenchus xylophilus]CAG9108951.1 unnamed protein product [Bursaphelenchus xylophilus]